MATHNNVAGGKVKNPRTPKKWETWVITNIWGGIVIKVWGSGAAPDWLHRPDWAIKTPPPLLGRNERYGVLPATPLWLPPHSKSLHRGGNQERSLQWLTVKQTRDKSGVHWEFGGAVSVPTRSSLEKKRVQSDRKQPPLCVAAYGIDKSNRPGF